MLKHAVAGNPREVGAQVQLTEHSSSYLVCLICMLGLHLWVCVSVLK